jgi:hypothetical protein
MIEKLSPNESSEMGAVFLEPVGVGSKDAIYQRFFKGGLVVVLSAGAVWGALLLLRIAVAESFTAVSIHEVNAHGHAQIFGWVGLFVMGFAYQVLPRLKGTTLWRPDLARMTFYLMVAGIFARALGEPLNQWSVFRSLALAGSGVEILAIGVFVVIIWKTLRQGVEPLQVPDLFILSALVFFFAQSVYELVLLYATTTAMSRQELLEAVGTYQAPLRDLQIHGFAMLMIFGVGLRMFPRLFGLDSPSARRARVSFTLLVMAILGEAAFFIALRQTGHLFWIAPLYGAMVVLAAASILLTYKWGLPAKPAVPDRSTKFVRAAITWLHVSMILLVLMPFYMQAVLPAAAFLSESGRQALDIGFSHAYYGAIRHAITVGFISLTILGMAAKIVPSLKELDTRQLTQLWWPFALLNLGCALRVSLQVATDFRSWAYPVVGVSGLVEVTGIALWGGHIWRVMNGWRPPGVHRPVTSGRPIDGLITVSPFASGCTKP